MIEKEYEKLKELEAELKAMKELNADEDIIEKQKIKIEKLKKKIGLLIVSGGKNDNQI